MMLSQFQRHRKRTLYSYRIKREILSHSLSLYKMKNKLTAIVTKREIPVTKTQRYHIRTGTKPFFLSAVVHSQIWLPSLHTARRWNTHLNYIYSKCNKNITFLFHSKCSQWKRTRHIHSQRISFDIRFCQMQMKVNKIQTMPKQKKEIHN